MWQRSDCLTLSYLAVIMELPVSLWMNYKSEFGAPRDDVNIFFSKKNESEK